jgi:hypothetical protein
MASSDYLGYFIFTFFLTLNDEFLPSIQFSVSNNSTNLKQKSSTNVYLIKKSPHLLAKKNTNIASITSSDNSLISNNRSNTVELIFQLNDNSNNSNINNINTILSKKMSNQNQNVDKDSNATLYLNQMPYLAKNSTKHSNISVSYLKQKYLNEKYGQIENRSQSQASSMIKSFRLYVKDYLKYQENIEEKKSKLENLVSYIHQSGKFSFGCIELVKNML